jgi:hypothetical protein
MKKPKKTRSIVAYAMGRTRKGGPMRDRRLRRPKDARRRMQEEQ